ncbi:MAG TPA: hypothetical protein DDZ53_03320 [Firmicutes bacterium]|jgi:DNA-binding MarR family transcriptional regulator|nr:hypothetical protein [Bacillota bacterium]
MLMLPDARLLRVFHSVVSRLLSDGLTPELAAHNLSVTQYRALQYLAHAKQSDISGLATALATSVPAATKLVDRLQAADWVARHYSVIDRRQTIVTLTETGRSVINQLAGCEEAALVEILERLTAQEREQLAAGMQAFSAQAVKSSALQDLCLYCGEDHMANCPLDVLPPSL